MQLNINIDNINNFDSSMISHKRDLMLTPSTESFSPKIDPFAACVADTSTTPSTLNLKYPKVPTIPGEDRFSLDDATKSVKSMSLMDSHVSEKCMTSSYDLNKTVENHGYVLGEKIAPSLQGSIWRASKVDNKSNKTDGLVIKVTDKKLYDKSVAIVNGEEIEIKEDIVQEMRIIKWLTLSNPPLGMVKFVDFFQDSENFFLVQQDGGMDLFKFVVECHNLINCGALSMQEWQDAIKIIFKQIVTFVDWLHNKMNCCHLDISLENMLIRNVFVMTDHNDRVYLSHNFEVSFIDFGLAAVFDGTDFRCNKYVGKTAYKSPKVYGKKHIFDARKADVWSLGVVLFMIAVGAPPFKKPSRKEYGFEYIITGKMKELIESWDRLSYLTNETFDLLQRMLAYHEQYRFTIQQVKNHPFLR